MKRFPPILSTFIFEIRYASGHLYFDRCGQTLLDIERECEGWLGIAADPQTGTLERPDKNFRVGFSNSKFDFTAERVDKEEFAEIAKETSIIWKIIQANLGLDEFLRIGCRLQYLMAMKSIDQAEKALRNSELNIQLPASFDSSGYTVKSRNIVTVLRQDEVEYRVKLECLTRTQSIDPSRILTADPRLLSKRQDKARIEQIRQIKQYTLDPMYAVSLDVDCAQYEPETVAVEKYILEKSQVVKKDFLPILEKL
ncbi:hypothetical protein KA005_13270 [bacterium]|jgi:hypothetical protein|nr:hypothetical protein [bacterium]